MRTLAIAMLLAASSTAFATDYDILPGTGCVAADGDSAPMIYHWAGFAYNTDTSESILVECPILHYSGATSLSVTVYAIDGNATSGVECWLKARTLSTGEEYGTSKTSSTTSYSSTPKTISLSSKSVGTGTMAYLACYLPPVDSKAIKSAMVGYKVTES